MKLKDWLLVAVHSACVGALGAALWVAGCSQPALQGPMCPSVQSSICAPRATWRLYSQGFSEDEKRQLRDGSAMWEAASGGAVRFEWINDPRPGAVRVVKTHIDEVDLGRRVFLGVTRFKGSKTVLIDADEILPAIGIAGVFAHELGHVMGLNHSTRDDALMSASVHVNMCVTDDDLRALYEVML